MSTFLWIWGTVLEAVLEADTAVLMAWHNRAINLASKTDSIPMPLAVPAAVGVGKVTGYVPNAETTIIATGMCVICAAVGFQNLLRWEGPEVRWFQMMEAGSVESVETPTFHLALTVICGNVKLPENQGQRSLRRLNSCLVVKTVSSKHDGRQSCLSVKGVHSVHFNVVLALVNVIVPRLFPPSIRVVAFCVVFVLFSKLTRAEYTVHA